MQSKSEKIEISGYYYIDEPLIEILNLLPKEDQATYIKTFKDLYKSGINEGIRRIKYEKDRDRFNW